MHLADGIVDSPVLLSGASLLGAAAVTVALGRVRRCRRGAAWTGALAAFVLAAQAINIPVVPGASAHVVGAAHMTLAVGPARAIVGMFAVLLLQALLFADGGVTALFVNTLNIAVLPVTITHACRRAFGASRLGLMLTAIVGTTLGNLAGAASLSALLVLGAGAPLAMTAGWLLGIQGVAGLVEGLLTATSLRYLARRAPSLVVGTSPTTVLSLDERVGEQQTSGLRWGLALAGLGLLLVLIPFSSEMPDALELVMNRLGTR